MRTKTLRSLLGRLGNTAVKWAACLLATVSIGSASGADPVTIQDAGGNNISVYEVSSGFYQDAATYTASRDFYITSKAGLEYFRDLVNQVGTVADTYVSTFVQPATATTAADWYTTGIFGGKTVHLMTDVDLNNEEWSPIGEPGNAAGDKRYFYGNFNGEGHTISNLKATAYTEAVKTWYAGLFGTFGIIPGGHVYYSNLTIHNVTLVGYDYAGAIVGNANSNASTFNNCHVTGDIDITCTMTGAFVGGIVGIGTSELIGCSVKGNTGSVIKGSTVGGLAGTSTRSANNAANTITGSTVTGVTVKSEDNGGQAGGLVGKATNPVTVTGNAVHDVTVSAEAGKADVLVGGVGGDVTASSNTTDTNVTVISKPEVKLGSEDSAGKGMSLAELAASWGAAYANEVITLGQDVALDKRIYFYKGVTIDLNGHKLTLKAETSPGFFLDDGSIMVLKDSGTGGTFEHAYVGGIAIWVKTGSSLTFKNGIYNVGGNLTYNNGGTIAIESGVYTVGLSNVAIWTGSGKSTVSGGYFNVTRDTINWVVDGKLVEEVKEGQYAGYYLVRDIVDSDYVAENTTTGKRYLTLSDAMAEAKSGEVVQLIKTAVSGTLSFVPDGVVFNDNGFASTVISGAGTPSDPYLIKDIDLLKAFRNSVNAGSKFAGKYFKLTSDIDLKNEEWTPIGDYSKEFCGVFDGDNHTISNLRVTAGGRSTYGLFGRVMKEDVESSKPAGIVNVTINNATVKSPAHWAGALAGEVYNGLAVENCHLKGDIDISVSSDGGYYAGGLVGKGGYVAYVDCSVKGNEGSKISGALYVGGIVAWHAEASGIIRNCSVEGVSLNGQTWVGGIAGLAHYGSTVAECSVANINVAATDNGYAGQIVGLSLGKAGSLTTVVDNTVAAKSVVVTAGGEEVAVQIGTENDPYAIVGWDVEKDTDGKVVGGTFERLATEALADGYILSEPNAQGLYTVEKEPVAQIGDQKFETLADAIAAAQDGETVKLLKDVTVSEEIDIADGRSITLDLNGKNVALDNGNIGILHGGLAVAGTGTIGGASKGYKSIYLKGSTNPVDANYSTLSIGENVTVTSGNGYAVMVSANSASAYGVVIDVNGTVQGHYGALYTNGSIQHHEGDNVAKINVNSTARISSPEADMAAVYAAGYAEWTFADGCEVSGGAAVFAKGGNIVVNGGEFTANGAASEFVHGDNGCEITGEALVIESAVGYAPVSVEVKGGTFNSANANAVGSYAYGEGYEPVAGFVSGGSFSSQVAEEYCAPDYVPVTVADEDGMYTVQARGVAKIERAGETTQYFSTLAAAISAAQDGDTIEMIADVTGESVTVTKSVTITGASDAEGNPAITLENTQLTLSGTMVELAVTNLAFTGSSYINANNGKALTVDHVTAMVNPTICTPCSRSAFIVVSGQEYTTGLDLTVTHSTIVNTFGTDSAGAAMFGWAYLNSATICDNVLGSDIYRFRFIAVKLMNAVNGATYTIERNTVYGTNASYNFYAFDLYQNCSRDNSYTAVSKANVVDVTATGSHDFFVFRIERNGSASTKTIVIDSGSTLNGEAVTLKDFRNELNVNAGFYGAGVVYDANGKMTGGTFNRAFSDEELAEFAAEGLRSIAVGDSTYTLDVPVAQIGTTYYATLAEAIAAAVDGETVTLLKNCSGAGIVVPQGKFGTSGLTVDFGGFTYTVNSDPLAGSTGTQTQAFQLLKDNTITFKGGAIVADNAGVKVLVQNYSNLTLDGMTLDATQGSNSVGYVLSTNNGSTTIKDTTITAKANGIAFDVDSGWGNYAANSVEVVGNSVINGKVEVAFENRTPGTPSMLTLTSGTLNGEIKVGAGFDDCTVNKSEAFVQSAPDGYKWVATETSGVYTLAPKTYVAQIGANKYETLAEAIAAVPTDGTLTTITMIADVSDAVGISVASGKNFIVDFDRHTYTVNKPGAGSSGTETSAFQLLEGSTITFKNGTINIAEDNLTPAVSPAKNIKRIIQNYANLTLDNMVVNAANQYGGEAYALSFNNGSSSLINGTKVITTRSDTVAFDVYDYSSGGYASGSQLTIGEGVVINGKIEFDNSGNVAGNTALTVTGGTIGQVVAASGSATDNHQIKISGGSFGAAVPEEYCATGFIPTDLDPETGMYTVKEGAYVAQIGENKYETLAEAIAAVPTDGTQTTITMIADVSDAVGISVASGKNFIVDFAGHTYTVNKPGAGSSGTETSAFQLLKDSTITFKNGTINIAAENLVPAVSPAKNIKRIIQNYANLTLDNMVVNAANQYGGEAYALSFNNGSSSLINGTKIVTTSADTVAFDVYDYSSGGYASGSQLTIGEGVVINGKIEFDNSGNVAGNTALTVTGGTIGQVVAANGSATDGRQIQISGGTFGAAVLEEYCANGFIPKDNGDGTYGVKQGTYVAQIGANKYETLAEAIAAVADGQTIMIIADITVNGWVAINKSGVSFAIDTNGKTIERTNGSLFDIYSAVTFTNSVAGVGAIRAHGRALYCNEGADCTIESGSVIVGTEGNVINVIGDYGSAKTLSKLTMNGGTVTGADAVNLQGEKYGAEFVMNGGIINSDDCGIEAHSRRDNTFGGAKVTINDGTINARGEGGINVNGSHDGTVVVINGGTIICQDNGEGKGAAGIYQSHAYVTINGGAITGSEAIVVKGGTLDVYDGVFTATGAANEPVTPGSSGYAAGGTGDALYIEDNYGHSDYAFVHTVRVNVCGGTFISQNANAVSARFADSSADVAPAEVAIEGGAFKCAAGKSTIYTAESFEGTIATTGGIFNEEPADTFVADGYMVVPNCDTETKETYPYTVGEKPIVIETATESILDITEESIPHTSGQTVVFYESNDKGGKWTELEGTPKIASLPDNGAAKTYTFKAVVTDTTSGAEVKTYTIENTVGILHVAESACDTTTIIGVPWYPLGEKITVDSIVYLGNRAAGDQLMAYDDENKCYWTWTLAAGENNSLVWGEGTTVKGSFVGTAPKASEFVLQRGQGLFLTRTTDAPIYLVGCADGTGTTETTLAASSANKPTWTLVAAPSTTALNLNAATSPFKETSKNDVISLPTKGAGIKIPYTYKNGTWGTVSTTTVEIDGVSYTVPVRDTEHTTIPAGTGFWYLNKGGQKSVQW